MTTASPTLERGTAVWHIDPTHTNVEFGVRHLMISTARGRFAGVEGSVRVEDGDLTTAQVDVTIDAASVDTRVEQRDEHLRSADFLDVERFPELRFKSTSVERTGEAELRVAGDLTIRDVTHPVVLDVEERGTVLDPWGSERAGFSASVKLDRSDYGRTWNQALETGGIVVGDQVKIVIDVELVLQAE